jgi:microcystin-dependent protein
MGLSVGLGVPSQVPVGVVSAFAGVNAPAGWLMCAGQAVSRTEYSALFNALSTTYGSGDGSTTFNLPDLRGRVPAGVDNMGGTAASRLTSTVLTASNALGATGGTQTHTLTEAQMPAHAHTTGGSPGIYRDYLGGGSSHAYLGAITSTSVSNPYNTSSVGSGSAHTNTQPTLVLNYIIKATQ